MKSFFLSALVLCLFTGVSAGQAGGRPSAATPSSSFRPRLIRFSGTLKDSSDNLLTGATGVTFALYAEANGGSPLWLETQSVQCDATGHYSVLLGSTSAEGLPWDLFSGD